MQQQKVDKGFIQGVLSARLFRWTDPLPARHRLHNTFDGHYSATPLATSAHGVCHSTPTSLVTFTGCAGAYDSIDTRVLLALGACLHAPSSSSSASADDDVYAIPSPLAASTGASTSTSSVEPLTEQEITRLRYLLAASSGSSPTGSTGSATDSSGNVRPPSTQSGTSPWILDTGASFHMTHDSSTLSSIRALDSPVHVLTADGTSLPVNGRGIFSTSSFHVPDVAHVPRLAMQLISAGQVV
ncbi:uncharacterized protein LOC119353418 [Triticum dicoccoides]|uniref:uncharacterized protein LOC119353418 n=1 Tax=Triticum dicoccoides TaxID=85692 RepID=UPI00188E2F90|nr:uncharacterized protein LOC119353418 [Triticum dicoccoides]